MSIKIVADMLKDSKRKQENDEILKKFKDALYSDLNTTLTEAGVAKNRLNLLIENENHTTEFTLRKAEEALDSLDKQLEKLKKAQENEDDKPKLKDMYCVYSKITKTKVIVAMIKEYTYRIKEDNIIYFRNNT